MKKTSGKKKEKLRVWWIRNPPSDAEYIEVEDVDKAIETIYELSEEDSDDNSVFSNAYGLEVFEDGEWFEWYDDDGRDICEIMKDLDD